jgi:cellulose synthase/poly-beta-1,6-N-acetylglucosamine synthase-like glycosyltransferase
VTAGVYAIFWAGVTVLFYTYIGYGIVIYLLSKIRRGYKKPPQQSDNALPRVTFLVAAYNEAAFIERKIQNTLALDYPEDKLEILFVTDGSSDETPDIVKRYPRFRLFHEPARRGKIHAVNRVMKFVESPIVIFSDANTDLNRDAVKNIVRHYQDPKVGGVAGEKKILSEDTENASGAGEGLYWKYESFLKRKDSEVYSVVGAAGELFSVRTELYEPPSQDMIIEDFYLSLRVAARGYRFIYEPEAIAMETASVSVGEEWKRKVRICAGGFQAMARLRYLLNPFKYGILTFQYFSHRVLRWTLAPLFLPPVFAANIWLAISAGIFYQIALGLQLFFYCLALLGFILRDRNISIRGFFVPFYFCVMNASVFAGFARYLRGSQSVVWEKAQRVVK